MNRGRKKIHQLSFSKRIKKNFPRMNGNNFIRGVHMIVKKIQTNETVKFRVPAEVAEQIQHIQDQCKNLGWKFTLNDEITDLIAKKCKQALLEIDAEISARAKQVTGEPLSLPSTKNDKNDRSKQSSHQPGSLPISIPGNE